MPVNISDKLPAFRILTEENIFVMPETRAVHQDIRPLRIAILNLMPLKISTEIQLLRLLSNSPLQIEVDLVATSSYLPRNTSVEHLEAFYKTFDQVKNRKYDGFIITGAPVEQLDFEDVAYWDEIRTIIDWADHHVTSTLFICWAAQAGLYHLYGIPKYPLEKKMFGVFEHVVYDRSIPLVRGFDEHFYAPHSRHTEIRKEDIRENSELVIVSDSSEAGVYIVTDKALKHVFVTGHSEYDPLTLDEEYRRDKSRGLGTEIPVNYYPENNPQNNPVVRWRGHSHLLFSNWLNYYVYQITPFRIEDIQ